MIALIQIVIQFVMNTLYLQGQYQAAVQIHRQTLELRTKVLGPEHPDTLISRNSLASAQKRGNPFRGSFT